MGNFSRRDFIKFATGAAGLVATEHPISKKDRIKSPEINTKATWSDGLRQLQNLARTEMNGIEYAQIFIINGDFQGWAPVEKGIKGGADSNVDYAIDKINREQDINSLPNNTRREIVIVHTHPKNDQGTTLMPPSLFYGDINGLCFYAFKPESKHINFSGMVLDSTGIWKYELNKQHYFIQAIIKEAKKRISIGEYDYHTGVVVAEKYRTLDDSLIGNLNIKAKAFQEKSIPPSQITQNDINELIKAYSNAGIILEFKRYEELNTNLEPGRLTQKSI